MIGCAARQPKSVSTTVKTSDSRADAAIDRRTPTSLRALGDSRTPLYFLIFSSFLNIALDIIFIVPLGMGVAGAAWATVLSQLVSAALCAFYGARNFRELRVPELDWRRSPMLFP